ncbi:Thoeris anti-defense Tad2 family protein [Fructilactobacillus sp. Tb1]|uniref:Thoeris anti-defense Tad2 family protein n=1 Tax=Fructilactobacillus sp. Tb1 TaxID=3422304 RepID=UPI003D2D5FD9
MTIQEATKKASEQGLSISRHSWQPKGISIIPTNTNLCCLIVPYHAQEMDGTKIRWNPTSDDLTANDWFIY